LSNPYNQHDAILYVHDIPQRDQVLLRATEDVYKGLMH